MNIGERIKNLRIKRHLTLDQIGTYLGVNKATVQRYENGTIDIKRNVAIKLAEILQTTPSYIMGWDDIFDIPNVLPLPEMEDIPLLGTIACGEPILAQENIEGYVKAPISAESTFALTCKGDSMIDARILDGDIVLIRQQPDVENGEIAAVLIDNEATLKRVYKDKDGITLVAANQKYAPWRITGPELDEVRILGKAVYFISSVK